MRRWMLHGNISRKGYGNALIGRYGGCFEERYREVYDDRAYHAKGLDALAKLEANSRSEKRAMHGTEEASKYEEVEVSTFNTYISPKNLLSVTLNLIRRFIRDKYPEEECMGVWLSL